MNCWKHELPWTNTSQDKLFDISDPFPKVSERLSGLFFWRTWTNKDNRSKLYKLDFFHSSDVPHS